MDQWGRLLPAVERFPSPAGGRGFRPLADYVHSKGLKFGIHTMRGIARQAYFENRPLLGTKHDIARHGAALYRLTKLYEPREEPSNSRP